MTVGRALRWALWVPVLAVLIDFALSNLAQAEIKLFLTGISIMIPLSVAILGALGLGFFLGGVVAWIPSLRHRREARRANEALRVMEAKHEELRARVPGAITAPPR